MTFTSARTSVGGTTDGATIAPSFSATPPSTDGTSGSAVGADSAKIGSGIDVDGTSDFLADEIGVQPFFDGRGVQLRMLSSS